MKYFHELHQEQIDELVTNHVTIEYIKERYQQPDWCGYPNALDGWLGCWSLMDLSKDGLRYKISKEFCEKCDECKR